MPRTNPFGKIPARDADPNRSLSDVVREMIERELRYRQHRQMWHAARELQFDYSADSELTAFTDLDGDDFIMQPSMRSLIP
jgi:hypothetical protein